MNAGPEKHSLTLKGHRTSVSMESEFWAAFRKIAMERGQSLNQLAAEIDAEIISGEDAHVGPRRNRLAKLGTMPARRKIMNTIMIAPSAICS